MTEVAVKTFFLVSPGTARVPHRTTGIIAIDTQLAIMEEIIEAEIDRIGIVIDIRRNIVAFRGRINMQWSTCQNTHIRWWSIGHDIPGPVDLTTSGPIAMLLPVVEGDGSNKFPAGASLSVEKGAHRYHDTGATSIWIHPVGSLVGFIVFQGVLKGSIHCLLFHFNQGEQQVGRSHICPQQHKDNQQCTYQRRAIHDQSPHQH